MGEQHVKNGTETPTSNKTKVQGSTSTPLENDKDGVIASEIVLTEDDVKDYDHVLNHPRRQHLESFKRYQALRGCRRKIDLNEALQILEEFERPRTVTSFFNKSHSEIIRPRLLKRFTISSTGSSTNSNSSGKDDVSNPREYIYKKVTLKDIQISVSSKRKNSTERSCKKRKVIPLAKEGVARVENETGTKFAPVRYIESTASGITTSSLGSAWSSEDELIDYEPVPINDVDEFESLGIYDDTQVWLENENNDDKGFAYPDGYFSEKAKTMKASTNSAVSLSDDGATTTTIDEASADLSSLLDDVAHQVIENRMELAGPRTLREIIGHYSKALHKIEDGRKRYRQESQVFRKTLDTFLALPYVDHVPVRDEEFAFHGYYTIQTSLKAMWYHLCRDCLGLSQEEADMIGATNWDDPSGDGNSSNNGEENEPNMEGNGGDFDPFPSGPPPSDGDWFEGNYKTQSQCFDARLEEESRVSRFTADSGMLVERETGICEELPAQGCRDVVCSSNSNDMVDYHSHSQISNRTVRSSSKQFFIKDKPSRSRQRMLNNDHKETSDVIYTKDSNAFKVDPYMVKPVHPSSTNEHPPDGKKAIRQSDQCKARMKKGKNIKAEISGPGLSRQKLPVVSRRHSYPLTEDGDLSKLLYHVVENSRIDNKKTSKLRNSRISVIRDQLRHATQVVDGRFEKREAMAAATIQVHKSFDDDACFETDSFATQELFLVSRRFSRHSLDSPIMPIPCSSE